MAESRLNNSVLVTGASRGLGLETALTLAERGFRVWASMRDISGRQKVEEEARRRGTRVETLQLDVTDPASIDEAIQEIMRQSGSLYGVVNNAGITLRGYFEDFPDEEIRRIFEVNLFGVMNVTRRVLPHMRAARRGRIVMMSSIGGRIGSMSVAPYVASKFALEGFSESLSLEVKPLGLQVIIIEPGIVRTDIWDKHRRVLAQANDPQGPYYQWFSRAEREVDALLQSSSISPVDVAGVIYLALSTNRPRLRYLVGRRPRMIVALRRHLPGELFERFYFGEVLRRVTGGSKGGRNSGG